MLGLSSISFSLNDALLIYYRCLYEAVEEIQTSYIDALNEDISKLGEENVFDNDWRSILEPLSKIIIDLEEDQNYTVLCHLSSENINSEKNKCPDFIDGQKNILELVDEKPQRTNRNKLGKKFYEAYFGSSNAPCSDYLSDDDEEIKSKTFKECMLFANHAYSLKANPYQQEKRLGVSYSSLKASCDQLCLKGRSGTGLLPDKEKPLYERKSGDVQVIKCDKERIKDNPLDKHPFCKSLVPLGVTNVENPKHKCSKNIYDAFLIDQVGLDKKMSELETCEQWGLSYLLGDLEKFHKKMTGYRVREEEVNRVEESLGFLTRSSLIKSAIKRHCDLFGNDTSKGAKKTILAAKKSCK